MKRFARNAAIIGLLLEAGGGCAVQAEKDEQGRARNAGTASERPIVDGNETRDDEAEDASERTILERVEQPGPGLTLPAAFHGHWASSRAECRSSDWVLIEPGGYRAPDLIAVLIEAARIVRQTTPDGVPAATITVRVELGIEDNELYRGRVRMSRAGEHLYMSNPDIVSEAEHWQYGNVWCAESRWSARDRPNPAPGSLR